MSSFFTQNYFDLFELPLSFDIDLPKLNSHYRELQKILHPDRYASASDQERRLSVQKSTQVNEAFQTLKSAALRARYLLELKGIQFNDEKDTSFDPAFLMEQMELRENLAAVKQAADPSGTLAELLRDIEIRQQQMIKKLQILFATNNEESLQEAKQAVQKIRFLNRLQQEAEEMEEDLLDSY